mgnify:CR=1 FL=1
MSSFARRSIRVTAAAAGIAALGVGFAGQALAAPSLPEVPELPAVDPAALPSVDSVPGLDSFTQVVDTVQSSTPSVTDLPDAFHFEVPTVDTGAFETGSVDPTSALPSLDVPTELAAASLPSADVASFNGSVNSYQVSNPALPSLDSLTGLTSQLPIL